MKLNRVAREKIETSARQWWDALQPTETRDGRKRPGNRAALARLRRATDQWDAAAEPATLDLYRVLGFQPSDADVALPRVAVLASILAHVRVDSSPKVGRALGPPAGAKDGEGAAMTSLRLARLLAARGDTEIATQFRRAVALLGDTANVGDLAWLILTWDRDETGDRTRTLFAFAYHDASAHAPSDDPDGRAAIPTTNA
jgi:CRISPR system Cascade subunit CasB